MKLDTEQKKSLAKALYDIGKLIFGIIVLGQVVSREGFHFEIFLGGFTSFVACFICATILSKEG